MVAKLFIDTEHGEIVTREELFKEWVSDWLPNRIEEDGIVWAAAHSEDYTFETWVGLILTDFGGTMQPLPDFGNNRKLDSFLNRR